MEIGIINTVTVNMDEKDKEFLIKIREWVNAKKEEVWAEGYIVPDDLWELLEHLENTANQLHELESITHNLQHCIK